MSKSVESFSRGEKAAKIGFLVVALIGAVKGVVGFASASVSLLAQAMRAHSHSFFLVSLCKKGWDGDQLAVPPKSV